MEKIFGDVNADDSDRVFRFGRDGKPVLIHALDADAELLLDDDALEAALEDQSEVDGRDDEG